MTDATKAHLALGLALLPFLALAAGRAAGGYPIGTGDHAQYVLHARALSEGRDYTDTGYVYSVKNPIVGPRAYPPGLPATLVPFLGWGGPEGLPYQVFVALVAALFLWLAGHYFARRTRLAVGVAIVLLGGLTVEFLTHATRIGSDIFFCALVWGVIALADREGAWTWRRALLVTAIGAVAVAFRSVGVALVPAAILFCVLRRRDVGWRPLVPAAAWAGLFVALNAWLPSATSYADQLPGTIGGMIAAALQGVISYRHAFGAALFSPLPGDWPNSLWHIAGYLLAVVGLITVAWRWWRSFLACFLVMYVGVLLTFPWHIVRYMWPLVPLFLALVFVGWQQVLRRLGVGAAGRRTATVALAGILVIAQSFIVSGTPEPRDPRSHPDFRDVVARVEADASGGAVCVSVFEPRVWVWTTGTPAMGLILGTPDEWVEELEAQGVTHLIVGDLGAAPLGVASARQAIHAHPEAFPRIHANPSFSLHRFVAPASE